MNPNLRPQAVADAAERHDHLKAQHHAIYSTIEPSAQPIFAQLSARLAEWNAEQGFWASENKEEKLALIHSEVLEALEAVRHGDPENEVEELADAVIRILDYAGHFGLPLANALFARLHTNLERPWRHGKGF